MNKQFLLSIGLVSILSCGVFLSQAEVIVYHNSFNSSSDLNDFTVYSETFVNYDPPPLSAISIEAGQLKIVNNYYRPNGPTQPPLLSGRSTLVLNTSGFGHGYRSVLSQSHGEISWSVNVSNSDNVYNNGFSLILASTRSDPYSLAADGYALQGGGLLGNTMSLRRFDFGLGGGGADLVQINMGLGTLPQMGSFRISYNPKTHLWSVFGHVETSYIDPTTAQTLLGSAADSTYTSANTPFMGVEGKGAGVDYFDNLSVSIVPEPSSMLLLLCAAAIFSRRNHGG